MKFSTIISEIKLRTLWRIWSVGLWRCYFCAVYAPENFLPSDSLRGEGFKRVKYSTHGDWTVQFEPPLIHHLYFGFCLQRNNWSRQTFFWIFRKFWDFNFLKYVGSIFSFLETQSFQKPKCERFGHSFCSYKGDFGRI